MTQDNTADVLQFDDRPKPKMPAGLNVLTILTFIGCLFFISNKKNIISNQKNCANSFFSISGNPGSKQSLQ